MKTRFHNSTVLYRLTHILSDFLYNRGFGKWLPKPQVVNVNVPKLETVNRALVKKYGR